MKQFINWHAHSQASLLDGYSKYKEYAQQAKDLGHPAFCFTEHGNLFSLFDAIKIAKEVDIKYFPGEEFYQARKSRLDKDGEELAGGRASSEWEQKGPYHCGLIAYNNEGYHNLIRLSSRAFLEGYYVKPRIDHELLEEHHTGLVMLSGCLGGEVQQALLRDDFQFALDTAAKMQSIFGRDNYFIEMHNHGIEEEDRVRPALIEIAHKINAPMIATCDSHYTFKGDYPLHDCLLCLNTGAKVADVERFRFSGNEFYLKSYEEMCEIFPEEYVKNTMLIYDKYDLDLKFEEYHYPIFDVQSGRTTDEEFDYLVDRGAVQRFGPNYKDNSVIYDRLMYEAKVIKDMQFTNYFLIVEDLVTWIKNQGIRMGWARGSVAGCLVAYCMRITEIDPIKYNLIFERFLINGRNSPPDIDLDIDDRYRDVAIQYARNKYGYENTAQICTFNHIKAKKAVRDVARILDFEYELGDTLAKSMPPPIFGVPRTLTESMESAEFNKLYYELPNAKEVIDIALGIEGLIRETSVHASALVIADKPIMEYVPVMQKGEDKPIISQCDMEAIDMNRLLKIDFLGLRNLSIMDMSIESVKSTKDIDIDMYSIPDMQYEDVFQSLSAGSNATVFQVESDGLGELLVNMRPSSQDDIAAALALYRPGPMASNVHNEYVERKHGRKPVSYVHPSLKPHLSSTYGLLLYQEQLISLAQGVAGFNISDADYLRKAVGKKKPEEMKKWRERFINGCIATVNMSEQVATKLFNEIEQHAAYSFSSNHAYGYSMLTNANAHMKAIYPAEYMAAALSTVQADEIRLRQYLNEAKRLGITVLPPSINDSKSDFSVKNDELILYGVNAIKGIGPVTASYIIENSSKHTYNNIYDFMRKADFETLNKRTIEHLAYAGSFDELVPNDIELEPLNFHQRIELLKHELHELGVFLTDHPLNGLYELIGHQNTVDIGSISSKMVGQYVTVCGFISSFTMKMSKKGKKMFKILLDDLSGNITIDIYSNKADAIAESGIGEGDIIFMKGKVEQRSSDDEDTQIELRYFSHEKIDINAFSQSEAVILKFLKETPSMDILKKIYDIIDKNPGESLVIIELANKLGLRNVRFKFDKKVNKNMKKLITDLASMGAY